MKLWLTMVKLKKEDILQLLKKKNVILTVILCTNTNFDANDMIWKFEVEIEVWYCLKILILMLTTWFKKLKLMSFKWSINVGKYKKENYMQFTNYYI